MYCIIEDIKNEPISSEFRIEFDTIEEIKDLSNSLQSMYDYINTCIDNNETIPPLVYKIKELK